MDLAAVASSRKTSIRSLMAFAAGASVSGEAGAISMSRKPSQRMDGAQFSRELTGFFLGFQHVFNMFYHQISVFPWQSSPPAQV